MPPSPIAEEERRLSSTPGKKDPEDEVCEIVDELRSSTYLNPIVVSFLKERHQKDLFYEVFARQANLIKSRCQSFEDCHVTVYDKVLLCLTNNGNRFDNAAAQEYFCEEYLGISKDGNPVVAERILRHHIILKAILAQGKDFSPNVHPLGYPWPTSHISVLAAYPEGKYGDKYSSETKYGHRGQDVEEAEAEATRKDEVEQKIERLTSVYQKAKSDFEAVPYRDGIAKLNAARFLRDTAENTVIYFRDVIKAGDVHAASSKMKDLIAELEQNCKMAQASVVTLSGGRMRKFDRHDYEIVSRGGGRGSAYRGSSRRGNASNSGRGRYPAGDRGRISKRYKGSTRGDRRRNVEPIAQRSGFSRDYPLSEHRPFGYTRPVDSYQPRNAEEEEEEDEVTSHSHPYPQRRYPEGSDSPSYGYESRGGRRQREEAEYEDKSLRYGRGFGHEWEEEGKKNYGYEHGYERERERERQRERGYGHGSGSGSGSRRQERY